MKFRDLLLEVTSTGSKVDREEYSKEKKFIEIKKLLKLVKSHDEYSLYKYYDYLFLRSYLLFLYPLYNQDSLP